MPNTQHEDVLRDFISANLHILEEGLILEKTEFYLPNYEGSKGYIDILAFDKYGNYVIIEIKRRDIAAREALHELHKYVRLLKQNYGAMDGEFRLIVVSAEWHQLYSAFSEFKLSSPYMCEGFVAKSRGKGFEISKLDISDTYNTRKISNTHTAILFNNDDERQKSCKRFSDYMNSIGSEDYIIITLDINRQIPFPYMSYVCIRRLPEEIYLEQGFRAIAESEREADDIIDDYETKLIIGLLKQKIGATEVSIGYSARFHNNLMEGWQIKSILKFGIYKRDPRMKDDFIISDISSYDSDNDIIFKSHFHSSNRAKFYSIKYSFLKFLEDNRAWYEYADKVFSEIEKLKNVEIKIGGYNPMNILTNLNEMNGDKQARDWIPNFHISISNDHIARMYCGGVAWNGKKPDMDILSNTLDEDDNDFFSTIMFGITKDIEERVFKILGFSYITRMFDAKKLDYNLESALINFWYSDTEGFLTRNNSFIGALDQYMSSKVLRTRYENFPEI